MKEQINETIQEKPQILSSDMQVQRILSVILKQSHDSFVKKIVDVIVEGNRTKTSMTNSE